VGALIFGADGILLVERAREPLASYWSLPGGVVEAGETLQSAIKREVLEETGLDVGVAAVAEIFERIMPDAEGRTEYHYVLVDYLCRVAGGKLEPADDASDARWVPIEDLPRYRLTEGTLDVIMRAHAKLQSGTA
jgi:ADP-ribose pyrophosphatase YjhB (NUDIX family)